MKDKAAATHGSSSDKEVVSGGYRGRRPLRRRDAWAVFGLFALIVLGIVGWFAYGLLWPADTSPRYNTSSAQYQNLKRLLSEPVPADDRQKVTYYSNIATAYESLNDFDKALESMLKADTYIKDRTVENGQSVNVAVARYYQKLGNKGKARDYLQREIDRIKGDPTAAENAEVIKYLEDLKDKV